MSAVSEMLEPGAANRDVLPVVVDLDGTLLRIDSLHEAALDAVLADWRVALRLPGWLAEGKARMKAELARRWRFDPATLPYSPAVLAWLRRQRAAGRRLVLCTATHRDVAEPIARHLGLFDEVIATEGDNNLRGPAKAEALVRRFGRGGFVYLGNDATDHPVWDAAAEAVVVNAPAGVLREAQARHNVVAVLEDRRDVARAALRAMRPYQWVKNGLCLIPPVAAGNFWGVEAWAGAFAIALAFCLTASAIYLLNDISDLAADRAHARKSRRPFASGDLPVAVGLALAPALLLGGMLLGWASGALLPLLVYCAVSLAYNLGLKEQPLVDVFVLSGLYTIRLFGGGEASGHPVSLWLLGFSSFVFLSLAFVKRVSELQRLRDAGAGRGGRALRRGYMVEDIGLLQGCGLSASFASAIVLALYVQSETAARAYANAAVLWGAVPLLLFWQCRLWMSTTRGYMHDDPIVYAARDWVSWAVFGCLGLVVAVALLPIGR
ncbi:UbiA family prenyltransferase [Falsiroseomonas oryzae]|uniref:UbiA family prenyltransferase n=1 Tax=Falsiroseomonas oryzae TaxID=2766473 RepID=UPI0022EA107E|nr:UbiA family prenyltransferase [Roseomonas sp. MO-31]